MSYNQRLRRSVHLFFQGIFGPHRMAYLASRFRQPEIMDDPALDRGAHVKALHALARVHALTGTLARMWRPIERLIRTQSCKSLSVMDVGCGDGLLLRQMSKRASRLGCQLRLVGCDFSSRAIELCQAAAEIDGVDIELHQLDVRRQSLPDGVDIIINSLFLHHFADDEIIDILVQFAASAQRLVVIEDLLRSRLGFCLCWLGVHVITRSQVVHRDGPLSVRAAFSLAEIRSLLNRACLPHADVSRHWPERFLVQWNSENCEKRTDNVR